MGKFNKLPPDISRQQLMKCNNHLKLELKKIATELGTGCKDTEELCTLELETWRNKCHQDENLKKDLESEICKMEDKLEILQSNYKYELGKKDTELKEMWEDNNSLKNKVQELNMFISQQEDLRSENSCIWKDLNDANEKIKSLRLHISELEYDLNESRTREKMLLEYPDMTVHHHQKVHGDPKQDMEGQIQANQVRVKLLEEQTIKLQRTLNKLQSLSVKYPNI